MDILGQAAMNGMTFGGTGSLLERSRSQEISERTKAVQAGRAAANGTGDGDVDAKLREVASDFVSVFMNQMVKSMRATVPETAEMHGDNGEKFFQEMLDTEYSKNLASGSGYGLTDLVYQSLAAKMRVAQAEPAEEQPAVAAVGLGE